MKLCVARPHSTNCSTTTSSRLSTQTVVETTDTHTHTHAHTHTRTHARTHTHIHPRVDTRGGAHKKETEEKESVKVASGESRRADCDYSPDARLQLRAHKLDQRTDERPRPSAAEVTQQQGQTDDETGGVDGVAAGPNPPGAAAVDPPVRLGCGQQRH